MRVKKTFPSQNLREISSRDQYRNNNNYSGTGTIATSKYKLIFMIILRWLRILSIINDSITSTDYQKNNKILMFCIVQVLWKVENSFSLQNSVVFVVST